MLNSGKLGRQPESATEYQQPKSIIYQLEQFEKNLNRLQEVVVQLEGRLGPILTPVEAPNTKEVRETINNSPLSTHLHSLNNTLEGIITNLCGVHDALEI